MATKVKLRQKNISKGRKSLYLDFYPPVPNPRTGETTRREFLGMYIVEKPKSALEKQHNIETLDIGERIRLKRENRYNKPEIYDEFEQERLRIKELGNRDFVEYYKKLAEKRKTSNRANWMSALKYLESFTGGSLKFAELNELLLEEFKEYLLTTKSTKNRKQALSINSASSYFNKVKATLKQAYKEGLLQTDLNSKVAYIKEAEIRRDYVTIEELKKLVNTPCEDELYKRAAFFSALTGLRFGDIKKMTWKEIGFVEGQGYFLNFQQEKTKSVEVLPISDEAYSILNGDADPRKMNRDEQVLNGLKYSAHRNKHLRKWILDAGIRKEITFHNFRHTFATLQLYYGTDIYTVSKMLGHKNLQTTQIYAKVVDQAKIDAVKRIKIGKH